VHAVDLRATAQLAGVLRAAVSWQLYFGVSTAVPAGGTAGTDACAAAPHPTPGLGPVSALQAVPGQTVTKGQVLARADTTAARRALDAALQDLAQAQSLLDDHRSAAAAAAANTANTANTGGSDPAAESAAAAAQALVGPDLDRVAQGQARVAALQRTVADATITAPADGIVQQVGTAVGASPDCRTPVLVLRTPELEVHAQVDGDVRGRLRPGQPADVAVPDTAAQVTTSVIALPLSATAAATGPVSAPWASEAAEYPLDLVVPDPPSGALPGMPATVTITLEARPGVLAVPAGAVHSDGTGSHVLLLHCPAAGRNGRCRTHAVPVATGITVDQLTQITAGVNPGDTVAVP
jgi:RND family efflux transporter MFP subunit